MAEFLPSSSASSHLFPAVKFSTHLLLLHLCCFAKTTSAHPESSRERRSAHRSKEICAAPAVRPPLCVITSSKASSKVLLCVCDLFLDHRRRRTSVLPGCPLSRQPGGSSVPNAPVVPFAFSCLSVCVTVRQAQGPETTTQKRNTSNSAAVQFSISLN